MRKAADAQVLKRRQPYFGRPLNDPTLVMKQQWELGEAAGIEFFVKLPEVLIESGKAILEEIENASRNDEV